MKSCQFNLFNAIFSFYFSLWSWSWSCWSHVHSSFFYNFVKWFCWPYSLVDRSLLCFTNKAIVKSTDLSVDITHDTQLSPKKIAYYTRSWNHCRVHGTTCNIPFLLCVILRVKFHSLHSALFILGTVRE